MGEKICHKFIKTTLSEWLSENESLLNKILDLKNISEFEN
jgi:hypothetical protein